VTSTPPLRTPRLRLEPLEVHHAGEMVAVLADPDLYLFTGGAPPSRADLEGRYTRQVAGSGDPGEEWHTWVVRLGDDGPAVGYAQATVLTREHQAELAWVTAVPWQGRGVARESAGAVLAEVLDRGATRVVAHVHPDHLASQAVAAALGLAPSDRLVNGEVVWVREQPGTVDR